MKNTLLAALVAAAIAMPCLGQAAAKETAKLEAGEARVQAKADKPKADAKATTKEHAKLARKGKKTAKPKREAKAAG